MQEAAENLWGVMQPVGILLKVKYVIITTNGGFGAGVYIQKMAGLQTKSYQGLRLAAKRINHPPICNTTKINQLHCKQDNRLVKKIVQSVAIFKN